MTRITNFGRKRTYFEAGFSNNSSDVLEKVTTTAQTTNDGTEPEGEAHPTKKKRKRTKPSMRDGNTGVKAAEAAAERERKRLEAEARAAGTADVPLSKSAKKKQREKGRKEKVKEFRKAEVSASERRRLQRIDQKLSATTCFACREKGHGARDCPTVKNIPNEDGNKVAVVGICYRCGSTKHSLSRCKKPANAADPLPFASCFVCNGKGHLAGSCPQNKAKGIYPDGGSCKLCGDTSHLARDCGLRGKDLVEPTNILGIGDAAGADEDDFHIFKRHKNEVDRDEKRDEKLSKRPVLDTSSGVVTVSGKLASVPSKTVVFF